MLRVDNKYSTLTLLHSIILLRLERVCSFDTSVFVRASISDRLKAPQPSLLFLIGRERAARSVPALPALDVTRPSPHMDGGVERPSGIRSPRPPAPALCPPPSAADRPPAAPPPVPV